MTEPNPPAEHRARFLGLFLDQADLPGMQVVQDSRGHLPDEDDDAFARYGGTNVGMRIWMAGGDAPVWRLVDARWHFPGEANAVAYHRERLWQNAERRPGVPDATPVGQGCAVFGGVAPNPIVPDVLFTSYFYIFRVRSVVVKIFAAQSIDLPPGTLTADDLVRPARRAEELVRSGRTSA